MVIIEGSHRADGHTGLIAQELADQLPASKVISLRDYDIGHYTYDHQHIEDDFLPLLRRVARYNCIVMVTPIYWYTMSGRMKVFFDRLTDSMQVDKALGRSLAGKKLAAVSCGSEDIVPSGFFEPFELTAGYLNMKYIGHCHTWMVDSKMNTVSTQRLAALAPQLT